MTYRYVDRVKEVTLTTGTGALSLAGAIPDYQAFSSGFSNHENLCYSIFDGTNWEVGIGTFSSAGPTLSRDRVLASSNAGALVNFPAGRKEVWNTEAAEVHADRALHTGFQSLWVGG